MMILLLLFSALCAFGQAFTFTDLGFMAPVASSSVSCTATNETAPTAPYAYIWFNGITNYSDSDPDEVYFTNYTTCPWTNFSCNGCTNLLTVDLTGIDTLTRIYAGDCTALTNIDFDSGDLELAIVTNSPDFDIDVFVNDLPNSSVYGGTVEMTGCGDLHPDHWTECATSLYYMNSQGWRITFDDWPFEWFPKTAQITVDGDSAETLYYTNWLIWNATNTTYNGWSLDGATNAINLWEVGGWEAVTWTNCPFEGIDATSFYVGDNYVGEFTATGCGMDAASVDSILENIDADENGIYLYLLGNDPPTATGQAYGATLRANGYEIQIPVWWTPDQSITWEDGAGIYSGSNATFAAVTKTNGGGGLTSFTFASSLYSADTEIYNLRNYDDSLEVLDVELNGGGSLSEMDISGGLQITELVLYLGTTPSAMLNGTLCAVDNNGLSEGTAELGWTPRALSGYACMTNMAGRGWTFNLP